MSSIFVLTLSDLIELAVFVLLAVASFAFYGAKWWRQLRCNHNGSFTEDSACNALCANCGKNLGFIGAIRAQRKKNKEPSHGT